MPVPAAGGRPAHDARLPSVHSASTALFESVALQPRGIKWSTPLECTPGDDGEAPPNAATLDACMANIKAQFPNNGARFFTVTNAARDYDEFIKAYDIQRVAAGSAAAACVKALPPIAALVS